MPFDGIQSLEPSMGNLHYVMEEEVDLARYIHVRSPMSIELLIQLQIYWQRNPKASFDFSE